MIKRFKLFLIFLLLLFSIAAKRRDSGTISFHLESAESESQKNTVKVNINSKVHQVLIKPIFKQKDIDGFYPFLTEKGESFGISFKLKKKAATELQTLSTVATGRKIFTVFGNDPIDFVVIDGPISHGYLTCWKGFNEKHIERFKDAGLQLITPKNEGPIINPPPAIN
ncbi:MAG: hypothetical protein ACJ0K4_13180 [Verrucomicrobiales bacterium]|nr:MAG: hypothetical protein EVB09_06725 [Verrucomicrobiaceae bacterium]